MYSEIGLPGRQSATEVTESAIESAIESLRWLAQAASPCDALATRASQNHTVGGRAAPCRWPTILTGMAGTTTHSRSRRTFAAAEAHRRNCESRPRLEKELARWTHWTSLLRHGSLTPTYSSTKSMAFQCLPEVGRCRLCRMHRRRQTACVQASHWARQCACRRARQTSCAKMRHWARD